MTVYEPMDELFRKACRDRAREVNPDLDEVTLSKILEETEDMYQQGYIRNACRMRIRQERPNLDESGVDQIMKFTAMPPMLLVVSALAERTHLPEEERKQLVAAIMAQRVC